MHTESLSSHDNTKFEKTVSLGVRVMYTGLFANFFLVRTVPFDIIFMQPYAHEQVCAWHMNLG